MVLGLFQATLRPGTCLRVMPKNSSFSCFMVIFMSYCPQFLGFSRICMSRKNPDMFERYDQKLAVLAFYGRFHELLPTVLGFQGVLHVWESWPSTRRFRVLWPCSWVIAHIFWVLGRFKMTARHDTCLRALPKTLRFCELCPFSWVLAHNIGVPGRFKMTVRPDTCW